MTLDSVDTKPVLHIDMDNTLVDFVTAFPRVGDIALKEYAGREDDIPGIFALMDPMPGAIEAVHTLAEHYDVYVLSTAPWANPSAWSDEVGLDTAPLRLAQGLRALQAAHPVPPQEPQSRRHPHR